METNVQLTTATAIVGNKGVGSVTKVGKLPCDLPSSKPTKDSKKPEETKGIDKDVTFKNGYDTHLIEVEGFKAKPNIGIKGVTILETLKNLF
ncbi:hypothetical protein FC756_20345 [Lysinibacillus mangiferihumi]|uniref:Uncharacterized protein n=1 Tax=Lysinibacillus mangiferihumi TaxID=1130819 RepID=A0A4U2YFL6_9BACI|nr:hypothetical protein [Lysinibacillus mangiferihumi]TKI59776.1 hypothetical protein FC756_20345 [Lysinibacillus mangiferihumi]